MTTRRTFLGHALRLPAALAALPFLPAAMTLTQDAAPEGEYISLPAADAAYEIPVAYPGVVYPTGTVFDEAEITVQHGTFLLREVSGNFVRHVPLGMRPILVRNAQGAVYSLGSP